MFVGHYSVNFAAKRVASVITIFDLLASSELSAQTTAGPGPAVAAERFIDAKLSDSGFRHRPCVSAGYGDCFGGVQIVRGYRLGEGVGAGDTIRYPVTFQVGGIVGVSEAAPFFMPRSYVDSGEVLVVRRRGRWAVRSPQGRDDEPVRTTAKVAQGYFDLDAADRSSLDTMVAAPRPP
jgi:hypothetical protein